jgi:hypothetical protein
MTPTKLKELVLNDDTFIKYILVGLIHSVYNEEHPKEHTLLTKNDYDTFNWLLYEKDPDLRKPLLNYIKEGSISDIINSTTLLYRDMRQYEAKQLIYSLSRLLYVQDKFKNNEIGQRIKEKIEQWILTYKLVEDIDLTKTDLTGFSSDEYEDFNHKLKAKLLYQIIPSLNYDIFLQAQNKTDTPFTDLFIYDIKDDELKAYGFNYINNMLNDSETYERYFTTINDFINELISDREFSDFLKAYKIDLSELKDIDQKEQLKGHTFKDIITEDYLKEDLDDFFKDPRIKDIYEKYEQYLEIQEPLLNNDDVAIWRKKADDFIKHLETLKKAKTTDMFNMDYMLSYLAYSDEQKKAFKTTSVKTISNKPLSYKELKEKYKDSVLLDDDEVLDYNRKWGKVVNEKSINNAMTLRESITRRVETNTDLTEKQLKELKKIPKPSKDDLLKISDLEARLKEQEKIKKARIEEIDDIKDDIALINKQLSDIQDANQVKKLVRQRKKMEKQLKEKQQEIGQDLNFQINTDGKIVYEKENKRKKESYKLMVNADYNLQNFNSEGRNFLFYVPNINGIISQLNDDFITIDIDDYLAFTGRENTNVSRVRRNLINTLKEMRKESYDYSFYDEKGQLQEGSLVLIGDVKSTEFKGKATIDVQLGATFKNNLKKAFISNQIANVNKGVFKLGQGKNKKAENMAKELFIYFSQLARIEAKKGLTNGQWQKDLHLDTLITRLAELNLLNYNPNTYNKSVKEPLLNALNVGQELGLFKYKTNAFKYYDDVISTLNNGANVKDKITNFETGKQYGIRIILNKDMTDLEKNEKAHTTYNKYQNRYKGKRATKK